MKSCWILNTINYRRIHRWATLYVKHMKVSEFFMQVGVTHRGSGCTTPAAWGPMTQGSWSWASFTLLSWLFLLNNVLFTSPGTAHPSVLRLYVSNLYTQVKCNRFEKRLFQKKTDFWPFVCVSLKALPQGGIYIFASQLHTHLAGRGVRTVLVRGGKEVEMVQEDQHFSTHYQVWQPDKASFPLGWLSSLGVPGEK